MEKHRCKLCLRSFSNGRALGGHMRSHMLKLYVPPKSEPPIEQFGQEIESASSSSSDGEEEEEEDEDKECLFGYGLRENPKRSIRLVDPEFSFTAGSVVLQEDTESETESSKNPIRRRSKRVRKSGLSEHPHHQFHDHHQEYLPELNKLKLRKYSKVSEFSGIEQEPVSSISDTTPDEDVAYCLIMLSKDKWMTEKNKQEQELIKKYTEEEHSDDDYFSEQEQIKVSKKTRARAKYRCETCNKVFRSYQALGGHRASHKRIKFNTTKEQSMAEKENVGTSKVGVEEKIHECPFCFRVFASRQALGGHKRSHVMGLSTASASTKPFIKHGEALIDLNLPAPVDEDEDFCQFEISAVSDADYVNSMKR